MKKNFSKHSSIKWKLTFSISLIITIIIILSLMFSFIFFNQISNNLSNHLSKNTNKMSQVSEDTKFTLLNNMKQIDGQVDNGFNLFFGQMEQLLTYISNSESTNVLKNHSSYQKGNLIGYENYPKWNNSKINHYLIPHLTKYVDSYEEIQLAYFATLDKGCYISPKIDAEFTEFDCTTRPWYIGAIEKDGDVFWTNAYIDEVSKKPVITLSKVIKDGDIVLGVVGLDISLAKLTDIIKEVKIAETGYAFLVDSEGILLANAKNNELLGKNIIENNPQLNKIFNDGDGIFEYEENDSEKIAHFTTNKHTNWKIIVTVDKNDLLATQIALKNAESNNIKNLDKIKKLGNNFIILIGGFGFVFIIVGLLGALFLSNGITNRIKKIQLAMNEVSEGNLTKKLDVTSNDEIDSLAQHFNKMSDYLKNLIKKNIELTKKIESATNDLSSVSEETTAHSNEVTAVIEEIATASNKQTEDTQKAELIVNEFSNSIEQVIKSSENVKESIQNANIESENGEKLVFKLENTSNKNIEFSEKISKNIGDLSSQVNEISSFTTLIKGISEQTNLLALNASIEAARAGENGRGFMVVAEEVKKLAEQSSKSASQIEKVVQLISNQVGISVENIKETEKITFEQHEMVGKTKESFVQIKNHIKHILDQTNEVSTAMNEMENGKLLIKESIESISTLSEKTASSANTVSLTSSEQLKAIEDVSNAIQKLYEMADTLSKEVDKFKID